MEKFEIDDDIDLMINTFCDDLEKEVKEALEEIDSEGTESEEMSSPDVQ